MIPCSCPEIPDFLIQYADSSECYIGFVVVILNCSFQSLIYQFSFVKTSCDQFRKQLGYVIRLLISIFKFDGQISLHFIHLKRANVSRKRLLSYFILVLLLLFYFIYILIWYEYNYGMISDGFNRCERSGRTKPSYTRNCSISS